MNEGPPKSFCPYPFIHVATLARGNFRLCCEADPFTENIKTTNLQQWWTSKKMNEIRQDMLAGREVPECSGCYRAEKRGLMSKRTKDLTDLAAYQVDTLSPRLQILDLRPGNLCNLTCASCNSEFSSKIASENRALVTAGRFPEYMAHREGIENWSTGAWDSIMATAKDLKRVYISGGEPMLMKPFLDFLPALSSECIVELNTNLAVYNQEFVDQLKRFSTVMIGVSIDGVGSRFDLLRAPANFEIVYSNLKRLRKDLPEARLELNFTLYSYNADQILPLIEMAKCFSETDGPLHLNLNKLVYPERLNILNLPLATRHRIASELKDFMRSNLETVKQLECSRYLEDAVAVLNLQEPAEAKAIRDGKSYLHHMATIRKVSPQEVAAIQNLIGP